ncbi:MAG: ATP-binding cassette domain-containing protein [Oligoflexia bacterium]|nr:ATP-binding cassette domain-containing protein [Oligoflexia bacterium]
MNLIDPHFKALYELLGNRNLKPIKRNYIDSTLRTIAGMWDRALFRPCGVVDGVDGLLSPKFRVLLTLFGLLLISFITSFFHLLVCCGFIFTIIAVSIMRGRFSFRDFFYGGFGLVFFFTLIITIPATINLFSHPNGHIVLPLIKLDATHQWGPFVIPELIGLTKEGIISSIRLLIRASTSVSMVLWLILSVRWLDLIKVLGTLGISELILQLISMSLIFLHLLIKRSEESYLGRKCRIIVRENSVAGHKWTAPMIARIWEYCLYLMHEVFAAMQARGFVVKYKEEISTEISQIQNQGNGNGNGNGNGSGKGNILLELDRVSFSYGNIGAIKDFSLQIRKGESIVLLGANGSGKSTLLKILAGLIFAQEGTFFAFGVPITEKILINNPFSIFFRASIGMLFQNSDTQLFNPTVEEELAFGPTQLKVDEATAIRQNQEIMNMLGITHLKKRSPFELSGGEKRKVALASILAIKPEVLLLDEPTAGLDPRTETVLIDTLLAHRRSGKTSVIATHNLHFVPEVASRILIIGEDRKLLADGPAESILSNTELLLKANLIHAHPYSIRNL